jgi:lysophospholipase L1-like esterase
VLAGLLLAACGSSDRAAEERGAPAPAEPPPAPAVSAPEAPPEAEPSAVIDETPGAMPGDGELGGDRPIDESPVLPAPANEGDGEGEPPAVDPSTLPALTVWIAGDSTVANGQTPCPRGWGGVLGERFDERVTVNNRARGGRSVNTWLYDVQDAIDPATGECGLERDASGAPALQADWQQVLDGMKPGDYLFIQFGINDGDRECDRHVGIEAFQASYAMMAEAAKARGAHPMFLTPLSMIRCTGTTAVGSRGDFVPATIEAGADSDVPVIDLHQLSVDLYQSLAFCPIPGGDVSAATSGEVGAFFCDDHTHLDREGAGQIADVVVRALRDQDIPLAAYLR